MKQTNKPASGAFALPPLRPEGLEASIAQKTLIGHLDEALKWADELSSHLESIQARLFGPDVGDESEIDQGTADAKAGTLSSKLASMCGYAATILHRIADD